jgi:hypothetical protein
MTDWASHLVQHLAAHDSCVGVHPQVAPASLLARVAADSKSNTIHTLLFVTSEA